jgi:Bacterial extracellular solute-binding proteins, family 5 Middle
VPIARRLAAVLGVWIGGVALLAGASATAVAPPVATTLVVAIPGPFAGCDPASRSTTASTAAVLALVLPSAFTPGPLDTPVGDTQVISQAEVVSESPQIVDYTIAASVRWPSGAHLRPADLVRTWHERRADRVLGDLGYRDVASVRPTAAGTTVAVTFTRPYADWESLFNLIVPAATTRHACAVPSAAVDPSIGPYEIASATHAKIVLRVNPHWTGAVPAYTTVDFTTDPATVPPAPGTSARATYLPSPSLAELQAITSSGGYDIQLQHDTTIVSLDFAVRGASALPPAVRGALARFVNRAALVARLAAPIDETTAPAASHLFGQGQVLYPGPIGMPVSGTTVPTPPVPDATGSAAYGLGGDPARADTLLRADGYRKTPGGWRTPAGRELATCLSFPRRSTDLTAVAQDVASELMRQGVMVHLQPTTSGGVTRVLLDGTCTMGVVSRTGDGFLSHAAASWLEPTVPVVQGLTWTGVNDPVAAQDAKVAAGLLNPVVAAPEWDAMDTRLWDLMVGLPLYSPSVFVGWSPSIAGVLVSDTLAGFVGQVPSLLPTSTKQ